MSSNRHNWMWQADVEKMIAFERQAMHKGYAIALCFVAFVAAILDYFIIELGQCQSTLSGDTKVCRVGDTKVCRQRRF